MALLDDKLCLTPYGRVLIPPRASPWNPALRVIGVWGPPHRRLRQLLSVGLDAVPVGHISIWFEPGMVEDARVDFGRQLPDFYGRHRATLVLTCNAAADGRASASGAGTPCGERDERVPVAVRDETVMSTGSLDTPRQHCLPILTGPLPGKSCVCMFRTVLGNASRRLRTRRRSIADCEREPLSG